MDNKGAEYVGIKGHFFSEFIKKYPYLKPTAKTGKFFGTIFVIVVIIGFVLVNWFSIFSTSLSFDIKIGLPLTFFELNLAHPENLPIHWIGLIIDMIVYLVLGYFADVLSNYITDRIEIAKKNKKPVVYKVRQTESSK